jgi:hypothetical protein
MPGCETLDRTRSSRWQLQLFVRQRIRDYEIGAREELALHHRFHELVGRSIAMIDDVVDD